jgi:hypothetical protein
LKSFRGKMWLAHRVAWTEANGEIPPGIQVLHGCDNPPCWNEQHLFLGTNLDNMRDKMRKGRHVAGRIFGERNPHASLSGEDVKNIQTLALYVSQKEIAAIVGCNPATISRIVRGERRAQG